MSSPTSSPGADEQHQPHVEPTPAAATETAGSSPTSPAADAPGRPSAGTPAAPAAPPGPPVGEVLDAQPAVSTRRWLWDHIGRISGIVLGLIVAAVLCLLMAAGYSAAGFLLLLVLGGMVMIAVGGRIHGR